MSSILKGFNAKKFLVSAIVGAIGWTVLLTPYMIFIMRVDVAQYTSWLVMQFILVPIIAPIVFWLTNKALALLGIT